MKKKYIFPFALIVLLCHIGVDAKAQIGQGPIHIFGYYQNAFEAYTKSAITPSNNTFLTQQLNIIFQKDLAPKFRSFVNFEFLNTFEGSLGWGSASLKEAWVRYDLDPRFKLKMGLHIPVFNHLNDIKISTPLLPYIVRPIVYETSLQDVMDIENFVPERAFFQVYGAFYKKKMSYDYAVYVGNSPNANADRSLGQTGIDTTKFMLVGARLGLHWENAESMLTEFRLGISSTFDRVNYFEGVADLITENTGEAALPAEYFTGLSRWRIGSDLGIYLNRLYLHAELISVTHVEYRNLLDVNRFFAYGTLGWLISDQWETYISMWYGLESGRIRDRTVESVFELDENAILKIYTLGARYAIKQGLVLKAQVAVPVRNYNVDRRSPFQTEFLDPRVQEDDYFVIYGLALSVIF